MQVHCFEPSKHHFLRLLALRSQFMQGVKRRWHLHNVAMSSEPMGMVSFPAEGCSELCSLAKREKQGETEVRIL